ncbi:hypothetical protein OK074_5264 [Actinobacteria bacterium OK074]|nr:hypothetical protein OK074_5264 [Actinobacteria bacterium OK074]
MAGVRGNSLVGRGTWLWRRPVSNVLVSVESETRATATSYFSTYRIDGYTGGIVPPGPPVQVGHYEDEFTEVDGVRLLAARTLHLPFGGPTPRQAPTGTPA